MVGARRPTMHDVARQAGVSLKTVSRVVNDEPTVQREYVDKVRAAVARLGYRRNDLASNLRAGRQTATIGLVIEDLRNPFYSAVAREVELVARSHDALLVTGSSDEDAVRERELITELCQRRVSGLVVVPTAGDHTFCRTEMEQGTPMVFLDREADGVDADTVLLDNYGGAYRAARGLVAAGHRRIAVLGYELAVFTVRERLRGVTAAMEEAGVSADASLHRWGLLTPEQAATEAGALLDGPAPPTAFFCCNNRMTVGVVEELWRRRLHLDVAGFDDVELSQFFPIPVTLVAHDPRDLGRRAAELLFRRIHGHRGHPRTVIVPTRQVTRGTRRDDLAPPDHPQMGRPTSS